MSRLTLDGTAEPVSRDKILRREWTRTGNLHFPCSADHEQDWQPYRLIHTLLYVMTIHTYILWQPPAAHLDEHSRPQESSHAQRCLNTLTSTYPEGMAVRSHACDGLASCTVPRQREARPGGVRCEVWSSVFLAKGRRTTSIQEGLDFLGL